MLAIQTRDAHCNLIHPVRVTRIHVTRLSPRVGLLRQIYLIGTETGSQLVHPVSITRFPSFRTQPLENLSVDSVKNGFQSNPAPGENLESGNLVMETGCRY